ncbi:hypothetical protein CDD83_3504 [Cordyceps sp. RAO-2017]|nr:hypothetical protein CDD83_3504 [Cordyceps sp. RAO-2017]
MQPVCSWQKNLASPAKSAFLSQDSSFVASISHFDCLPKIWRRLTYGSDDVRFDVTYLHHPDVVTSVKWRKTPHGSQNGENILFTHCLDGFIRIWVPMPTSANDSGRWQLCRSVSLGNCVSRSLNTSGSKFACFIDNRELVVALNRVMGAQTVPSDGGEFALHQIANIPSKTSDVCVVVDRFDTISAWAFESLGPPGHEKSRVLKIGRETSRQLKTVGGLLLTCNFPRIQARSYCDRSDGKLHMIIHLFDGRIAIFESDVTDFFDRTSDDKRLSLNGVWSGHSAPVQKILRDFSGRSVVSRTGDGECIIWKHTISQTCETSAPRLSRRSRATGLRPILRACILRHGSFVVFLDADSLSLWDCRHESALLLTQCPVLLSNTPLCLIKLPRSIVGQPRTAHIATVMSDRRGVVWQVDLPSPDGDSHDSDNAGVQEFCCFELETPECLSHVLPVDPAGSTPAMSGFLDVFARDVAISYHRTGRVDFWTARVDPLRRGVDWLSTCSTNTGICDPALVSGSMLKKAALVDYRRSQITIWDIGGSQLEFEEDYRMHNAIRDLDWTSTPDGQSILAVGFQHHVVLLSQMRFDYLNKGPAWGAIREIRIRDFTPHPIGDSTWLSDGHLLIGAGNQLIIYDRCANSDETLMADIRLAHPRDGSWDLFDAVQRLNGPIPVFHPQFLSQCILAGKNSLVQTILAALYRTLKYLVPGEPVDDYLGLDLQEFYTSPATRRPVPNRSMESFIASEHDTNDQLGSFSELMASSVNQSLLRIGIPQLSGLEQIQLADIVECVAVVEKHRRSLDENGARFMLFCRHHALRRGRTSDKHLSWREICWAYHSTSQDLLVEFVTGQAQGEMTWEHARETGLFMWLADPDAVKRQFEALARNSYTHSPSKNPVDCSLYYLALRKKTVLLRLWRTANANREQAATQRLLANNFDDSKWRKAALKNAYALLSKRRFQYAAAFFLLAGQLQDAVDVCVRQLRDVQLAIAVSRVHEGDEGPVLRRILQKEVLPMAAQEGNRWLASWAFWMLGRRDVAVKALVIPVYTLLDTAPLPETKSRLFLTDDPALVVLYSQLRQKTLQTLTGASTVTPESEWEFVLHSAKLYDRMGCDLLGLELVRNWEFPQPRQADGKINPLKLLRRRSSLVVNDLTPSHRDLIRGLATGSEVSATSQPELSVAFREPDAATLLDSFGF